MQEYGKNYKSLAKAVYIEDDLSQYSIFDIREPEEVCVARIKGVLNVKELHSLYNFAIDNPDKRILLHCKVGGRASQLGSKLVSLGCTNVYFFDDVFSRFYEKYEIVGNDIESLRNLSY